MEHKTGCCICGKELVYLDNNETMTCYYCDQVYDANVKCLNGHYVCDQCHSSNATEFIESFCIRSRSEDPIELALNLMRHPAVKMHGPEHHYLVPAVLLAAYYNSKGQLRKRIDALID